MNSLTINFTDKKNQTKAREDKSRKRWTRLLYVGGIGGFAISLTGLLMSASAFFGFVENPEAVNRAGTWLMVAAFPLLMLGAHAMDKIAAIDKKEKHEMFETEEKRKVYLPGQWKKDALN